ncbi:MAG: hypothetical protein Q9160_009264 [Pyrenula sp. 1 TL-2023]
MENENSTFPTGNNASVPPHATDAQPSGTAFHQSWLDSPERQPEQLTSQIESSLITDGDTSSGLVFTQIDWNLDGSKVLSPRARTIDSVVEQITFVISDQNGDSFDVSDLDASEDECDWSLDRSWEDLDSHTAWLMDVLPTLEQTIQLFGLIQENEECRHGGPESEVSEAAQIFISQVQDKFQHADSRLSTRLGEANWQRSWRIRNALDITAEHGPAIPDAVQNVFKPFSQFYDSGIGSSLPMSSFRPQSLATQSSFMSTACNIAQGHLHVPSTPAEVANGAPFQCFLCKRTLRNLRNRADWK